MMRDVNTLGTIVDRSNARQIAGGGAYVPIPSSPDFTPVMIHTAA
jgi:hypothetical protein